MMRLVASSFVMLLASGVSGCLDDQAQSGSVGSAVQDSKADPDVEARTPLKTLAAGESATFAFTKANDGRVVGIELAAVTTADGVTAKLAWSYGRAGKRETATEDVEGSRTVWAEFDDDGTVVVTNGGKTALRVATQGALVRQDYNHAEPKQGTTDRFANARGVEYVCRAGQRCSKLCTSSNDVVQAVCQADPDDVSKNFSSAKVGALGFCPLPACEE